MIPRPALAVAVTAALAGWARAGSETPATASKKEQRLAEKAKAREVPAAERQAARTKLERDLKKRVGKKPSVVVNIYNTWTHETVAIDAGQALGRDARAVREARGQAGELRLVPGGQPQRA